MSDAVDCKSFWVLIGVCELLHVVLEELAHLIRVVYELAFSLIARNIHRFKLNLLRYVEDWSSHWLGCILELWLLSNRR